MELLVSTMIGLVVMGSFMGLSRFQLVTMQDQSKQADLQGSVRGIIQLFERDVRRAGSDPLCTKLFDSITSATSWHIYVQSDLNGDGVILGGDEYVGYVYMSGGIYRYADGELQTLITGLDISGSSLRYFDADGQQIQSVWLSSAQRDSVRKVRLELKIADDSHASDGSQQLAAAVSSDVNLRNRFFLGDTDCTTPPDNVVLSTGGGGEEEEGNGNGNGN